MKKEDTLSEYELPKDTSAKEIRRFSIHEWDEQDRPREKLLAHGVEVLSNSELLGILVGSGNGEESAVALMQRILSENDNSLKELGKRSYDQLVAYKGIGMAKAATIMAAMELGRRRRNDTTVRKQILEAKDCFDVMESILCDKTIEEFWAVYVNHSNRILSKSRIGVGGITSVQADVRIILQEALKHQATGIVLVHNHPSENILPSKADKTMTKHMVKCADILNIRILDHIIIGGHDFYSFGEHAESCLFPPTH